MLEIFNDLELKRQGTQDGLPREEGEALYTFIKEHQIKKVVETGIKHGFSSCYILAALPPDGELISLEANKAPHIGSVVPAEYQSRWKIIYGLSKEKLQEIFLLNQEVDLFFHDSEHHYENQMFEYETALPFINFIGSHDIRLYGPVFAWETFIKKHNIKVLVDLGQLGIGQVNKESCR